MALEPVFREFGMPVLFCESAHSEKRSNSNGLEFYDIRAIEPQGFLEFLQPEADSQLACIAAR